MFILILINVAQSGCYYNRNYPGQIIEQNSSIYMEEYEGVGYGYWFKYQPLIQMGSGIQFTQQPLDPSSINYLLSAEFFDNKTLTIIHYANIDKKKLTISHFVEVYSQQSYSIIKQDFDPLNYEGLWIFFGIQSDTTIQVLFYIDELRIYPIQDSPKKSTRMRYYLGYYGTLLNQYNDTMMSFNQFKGKLSNFIIMTEQITVMNFDQTLKSSCAPLNQCPQKIQQLITDIAEFDGKTNLYYDTGVPIDLSKLTIYFWAKANPIRNRNLSSFLLRISQSQKYIDSEIKNQLLYIKYLQYTQPLVNGVTVSTYSYSFPTEDTTSNDDDIQSIYDPELQVGLTLWHFVQFEIGRSSYENTLFTFVVPKISYKQTINWGRRNYQFTASILYFYIGGGQFQYDQGFQGIIQNVNLLYCYDFDMSLQIQCHYSCNTCIGPTSEDCSSCIPPRALLQNQCFCQDGYLEYQENCTPIDQVFPSIKLFELEYNCTLIGYDQCDDNIVCSFGYFRFEDKCIKCPFYNEDNLSIGCVECVLNPNNWNFKCSNDLISSDYQQVFIQSLRQNPALFHIDLIDNNFQLSQCEGCSYICQPMCQNNTYYGIQKYKYICLDQYYYKNEMCNYCGDGCKCLQQGFCYDCLSGFAFDNEQRRCIKCNICSLCYINARNKRNLECRYCPSKYYLNHQNQCLKCGFQCESCTPQRCLVCQSNTFLSFDGQNCLYCSIPNCEFCFQYYTIGENRISTLTKDFNPIDMKDLDIVTSCARCQDQYYLKENQCLQQADLVEVTSSFSDCVTGVVTNTELVCLIGSQNSIQLTQCQNFEQYCQSCIRNYMPESNLCIICIDGYYVKLTSGSCQQCPIQCATCLEQNSIYKDAWRRNIKAFEYYFFKDNLQENFRDEFLLSDISQTEVICTSCPSGQRLHNNQCIKDCDRSCQDCQVINGVAQCKQCHKSTFGIMRSTNNENTCINCPYRCQACHSRNKNETSSINPFFNFNDLLIQQYSYQCYQKFDDKDFLDNEYGVVISCQKYQKCYYSAQLSIDVFCNSEDYYQKGLTMGFNSQFKQDNCYIDQLNICLQNMQSAQLSEFFNQKVVKELEIIINFIQGQAYTCMLMPQSLISNMLQNVFSLNKSKLILTSNNANLILNGNILIQNFTDVEIRNIIFLSSYKVYYILFQSLGQVNLKLENLQIIGKDQMENSSIIIFNLIDPQNLIIKNLVISEGFSNFDSLFQINVTKSSIKVSIKLNQFTLGKAKLSSVNIFKVYQQFNNQQPINFDCKDVQVLQSNLVNFSFISFQMSLNDIGSIFLDGLFINETTIDTSVFILGNNLLQSKINDVRIQKATIRSSIIFKMVILNVSNFNILECHFQQSQVFTNTGEYSSEGNTITMYFTNLKFIDNSYLGKSQFLQIEESNQNISTIIQNLVLNNNYFYNVQSNKQLVSVVSFQKSLIYIQCNYIYLDDIFIQRAPGNPEFALLDSKQLEINNFKAELHEFYQFQGISKDISCLNGFLDLYFIIYISDINYLSLKNIQLSQLIILDYSAIIIQSANVLNYQQSETIILQDLIFSNNVLLMTQNNKKTSLISIKSQQIQSITILSAEMKENILNQYIQDLSKNSATTFMIESDLGNVSISDSTFYSNFLLNSTNSILFIQSKQIQITTTYFKNNNIFNFELFKQYIVWGYAFQPVSLEQIYYQDFKIQSNGGSGQFITQFLLIDNLNIDGSYAFQGGSFYISTQANATIQILNSQFKQSITSDFQNAVGGVLYIDGSKSILSLLINNNDIQYVKSRSLAGFLFLTLSDSKNNIWIQNSQCINCMSINAGFIYLAYKSLTSIYPTINILNLTLQNPDIEWFGQNTFGLTTEEIQILQFSSYLIYLTSVQLLIGELKVSDGQIFGILYFEGCVGFVFNNSLIQNYQPYFTPLINIKHETSKIYALDINNIEIYNITQLWYLQTYYFDDPNKLCDSSKILDFNTQYRCLLSIAIFSDLYTNFDYFTYFDDDYKSNNFNCFQRKVRKYQTAYNGMVQITNTKSNIINIRDITMSYITYNVLAYGILSIRDFEYQNNLIFIERLKMTNNVCDSIGCLLLAWETEQIKFVFEPALGARRNLFGQYKTDKAILSTVLATVQHSKFINNSAINGSGIYSQNINLLLSQCIFTKNSANSYGGALFFTPQYASLYLLGNVFTNNVAKNISGEGIYLQGSLPKLDDMENFIIDNGEQDVSELPQRLQIKYQHQQLFKITIQNDSNLTEIAYIQPYKILGQQQLTQYLMLPTGQSIESYQYFDPFQSRYIPYNLSLRIIPVNRFNQRIYDMEGSELTVLARQQNEIEFSPDYIYQSKFIYNLTSQDFNLDSLIIYFNPYSDSYLELMFQCNRIQIPIYNSQSPFNKIDQKNYELRVQIKPFQCQLGEYYNQTNQSCIPCVDNTYSVSYRSTNCLFKDDTTTSEVNQAQLKIQKGYWRAYYYSKEIDNCYHLQDNCIGGWGVGDQLCAIGHIGALCEQCDLYNINGNGSYSVSEQYSCGNCNQVTGNSLTITFISIWTLVSILMSVDSTVEIIQEHIVKVKLKSLGYIIIDIKPSPAVLIKVFTNYIQIVTTISTFQLQLPSRIGSLFNSVGNPIQSMAYSLDCFLIAITSINIIYFRIIWSLLVAFMYILIFLLGFAIIVYFDKARYNVTVITTCFIYLYIFLQPNLVGSLISLISYRFISNEYWIQGNVSYRYDTKNHLTWLVSFVVPLLLLIGFVIPFILWYGMYSKKNQLESIRIKKFWGYLYNEYRRQAYYWETIKIIQREFIIIVLAYYEDFIAIKAALVFLCLFFYSYLTNVKRPYNTGTFNVIDAQSTIVCSVSVILATTIYTAQQFNLEEIVWPFYLIIITINTLFVLKILYLLIEAYTNKLQNQINLIKDNLIKKYPNILEYPILQQILQSQELKNKRIKERFKKLKDYLIPKAKLIIQFKRQNNFFTPLNNVSMMDNKYSFEENKMVLKHCLQKQLTSPNQQSNDDQQLISKRTKSRTRIHPSKSSEDNHIPMYLFYHYKHSFVGEVQ